jgi:hypothetical protein
MEVRYSPTQIRLLKVLGDGLEHTREELHECCAGSHNATLYVHICLLKKRLNGESNKEGKLGIIPNHDDVNPTYRLVKLVPATLKDIKSLELCCLQVAPHSIPSLQDEDTNTQSGVLTK